ncbi:Crp/Fnr family transcriptional regulator [Geothermobacter ehrlichii]|uniref:Crp/Fnr family transcriptional regulator n=1 Tax=Geothermobacter ehrlichii TaxID=213224 RepID=A0A5D3WI67_9BACT|nr:Crp/Fnr family transcriptional regulator [Geothermobacter ehrlichii]TYO98575.1 Crp/Fnr family transcriptional regulator [Geothermobacter ehrlichii]
MPTKMKLTKHNLLETLAAPEHDEFLKEFKERCYARKSIVSSPVDEEDLVFIVKSGRVRVYLAYEDKEFTLSILGPGDIYSTHTRALTQAMDEVTILVMDAASFRKKTTEIPAFSLTMVKVLGDLLKNSFNIINGLVFKDAQLRLAEFLVNAAEDTGVATPHGIELQLGLTTEDIGLVIGSSRQTISLLVNDLRKSGILEKLNRRTLLIKDLERLKEMAADT